MLGRPTYLDTYSTECKTFGFIKGEGWRGFEKRFADAMYIHYGQLPPRLCTILTTKIFTYLHNNNNSGTAGSPRWAIFKATDQHG